MVCGTLPSKSATSKSCSYSGNLVTVVVRVAKIKSCNSSSKSSSKSGSSSKVKEEGQSSND